MGGKPYMLAEQGVDIPSSVFLFNPERVPTFVYVHQAQAAVISEQQACMHQSTSTSLKSLAKSPLTMSSSLKVLTEVPGACIFIFTGKQTHIDTIDTDIQTHRDFLQAKFLCSL